MSEQIPNINTDAHYSTEIKVKRSGLSVAQAPEHIPTNHLFSDIDANARLNGINNDIYQGTKANGKPKQKKSLDKLIKMQQNKKTFDTGLYFKIFAGI